MELTILRRAALATFAFGVALLIAGLVAVAVRSTNSAADELPTPTVTSTPTKTATPRPTATGTPLPPTPTPTPFAGDVARFQIARYDVDSAVELIGLDSNNTLETPTDPHDTGWYSIYDRPGWGGNAVFAAHVNWWPDIRGPFYNLADSKEGDRFDVVMTDGTRYIYEFMRYERYDADTIPMGDLIWPKDKPAGEEWITLITCGGTFESATPGGPGHYLHRDVVVAKLIETIRA